MTVSVATTWMDLLNAGGTVFVLAAIIFYGARMMPRFLERWGKHTEALVNIANKDDIQTNAINELRAEIKELRHDLDSK